MLLSRLLPKTKDPDLATSQAVFMTLGLIVFALVLPSSLSNIFPKHIPETTKSLIMGAVVLLVSWDMVNDLVGNAIKSAKEKEIESYLKNHSSDNIRKKQDLEFYAVIPIESRRGSLSLERIIDDQELKNIRINVLARDLIVRTFEGDSGILNAVALRACMKQLGIENDPKEEIKRKVDLKILEKDIHIYLQGWLVQSIKYDREMPAAVVKQRYPSEVSPDRSTYINILKSIKDKWLKRQSIQELFPTEYQEEVNIVLENYMGRLITQLRNYNQKSTPH